MITTIREVFTGKSLDITTPLSLQDVLAIIQSQEKRTPFWKTNIKHDDLHLRIDRLDDTQFSFRGRRSFDQFTNLYIKGTATEEGDDVTVVCRAHVGLISLGQVIFWGGLFVLATLASTNIFIFVILTLLLWCPLAIFVLWVFRKNQLRLYNQFYEALSKPHKSKNVEESAAGKDASPTYPSYPSDN